MAGVTPSQPAAWEAAALSAAEPQLSYFRVFLIHLNITI